MVDLEHQILAVEAAGSGYSVTTATVPSWQWRRPWGVAPPTSGPCCRRRRSSGPQNSLEIISPAVCSKAGADPDSRRTPLLSVLPPEVVEMIISFHRAGDLHAVANCAATARAFAAPAAPLLCRIYQCRQCSAPLFHRADLIRPRAGTAGGGRTLCLADGPAFKVETWPSRRCVKSQLRTAEPPACARGRDGPLRRRLAEAAGWQPRPLQRSSDEEPQPLSPNVLARSRETPLSRHWLECGNCGLYLGERAEPNMSSSSLASVIGSSVGRLVGDGSTRSGVTFICRAYVCEADPWGPIGLASVPLRCTGARRRCGTGRCGQVLAYDTDVLSTRHCWSPPNGSIEAAWYVNGVVRDSVVVGPARRERLGQGPMAVADMHCSACGGSVGWKFVEDFDSVQRNRNQVGRFGLCTSSLAGSDAISRRRQRMRGRGSSSESSSELLTAYPPEAAQSPSDDTVFAASQTSGSEGEDDAPVPL
eukprot:gnl/TRDRNA2_/TRDRNA2_156002_c0_seq1.p1 gnl/TRDRNA2_/TRDRNA2_156002_c0~~gnl/TRDRNA2_/TRDRNA2_156002_c0_seq1.p1  ORF type:complete len:476 (+),score=54.05 gnl/TRDRNA2_/TRDRNA2_156002_c0_seq1:68-1495(+)